MIRVTVYAAPGGGRQPSTTSRDVDDSEVHEELRKIGLEWRQADYFPTRQVVITLDPIKSERDIEAVQAKVREASSLLEGTGLL